jgi:formylglycine-generating enzyme required for sulfatase activity
MRIFLVALLLFSNLFGLDRASKKIMESESKIALVIGNSEYNGKFYERLPNPKNDVKEISKKLKKLGFKVIEGYDVSGYKLSTLLKRFYYHLSKAEDGVGLFYFAGHGIEVNGENYLLPTDLSVDKLDEIPIFSTELSPILRSMNGTGKRLNIAIVDACRENPFVDQPNRGAKIGGLAPIQASGTFVVYSAESGKLASDGRGKLSPFAKALSKHIETPQTIERLFKKVRSEVYSTTKEEQLPTTYSSIQGDFYFKLPEESKRGESQDHSSSQKLTVQGKKHRIYVSTTPENARVRILNIKPKYFDGIDLKTDKALVEVTKSGYKKYLKWHRNLKDEAVISVELQPNSEQSEEPKDPSLHSGFRVERSQNLFPTYNKDMGSYILPAMVEIKRGSFMMGSNSGDSDEKPLHRVDIDYDFYIGKYEVTVEEFRKFIDNTSYRTDAEKGDGCYVYNGNWEKKSDANWKNPYFSQNDSSPVTCISWNDAKAYTEWLSKKSGKKFSLPSEAEWEYMARAGTDTKYSFGDSKSSLGDYAWYSKNSGGKTHPVGEKKPNPWSIYDVHGNVWEWCEDWYIDSYSSTPTDGSSYDVKKSYKALRGGSWYDNPINTRSANRNGGFPSYSVNVFGFRLKAHK